MEAKNKLTKTFYINLSQSAAYINRIIRELGQSKFH